jgi:hypothetical protein
MNYQTRKIQEDCALPLPITQAAHKIARQFSQQQPTQEKAQQVRWNTLAVCAVNDYLQMMGIPTNLTTSDSWNPFVRLLGNVADLEVIGLGRLECRAIKANEQTCYVPPEVWEDRIGYVVVRLDEMLGEANVLGFTKQAAIEHLHISQLQPLENLLSYLSQLSIAKSVPSDTTLVKLSQWLHNVSEASWQTVESLFSSAGSGMALSFRRVEGFGNNDSDQMEDRLRRAKLIDLGMQLSGHSVALVVELRPESHQKTGILLQVHPTESQMYLPPLLQLIVLDESGEIFLEAKSRHVDNYIQLQFSGTAGEKFSVKVALGDVSFIENFAI